MPTSPSPLTSSSVQFLAWSAALAIGVALGCKKDPPPPPTDGDDTSICKALEPAPMGCLEQRRIVKLDEEPPCPTRGNGWTVSQLGHDGPLAKYCVYEKNHPTSDPAPHGAAGDCPAYAQTLDEDYLSASFTRGVGAIPADELSRLTEAWSRVRIAVIDTGPSSASHQTCTDSPTHGQKMASIVQNIAHGCFAGTTAPCEREVHSYVGLPRTAPDMKIADQACGGEIGYASDVAVAIAQALDEWQNNDGDARLIINLSLAWSPDTTSTDQQPVYEMLERAACHGALIIAAAGNRSPYSCDDSSFAPAQWETHRRPTPEQCRTKFGIVPPNSEEHPYDPLVHSITPLTDSRQDLLSSPPSAASRIAALGFQATAIGADAAPMAPISGSSVSAAVVSGIAALVWSGNPELSPAAVMHKIWDSGEPRAATVQTQLPGTAQDQKVVSACAALSCGRENPPLPAKSAPSTDTKLISVKGEPVEQCSDCDRGTGARAVKLSSSAANRLGEPRANPQPSKMPCPMCWVKLEEGGSDSIAYLQLSSDFDRYKATGFIITLHNDSDQRKILYYTVPLSSGDMLALQDSQLNEVEGQAPTQAWIEIYFDGPGGPFTAGNEMPVR
jgi:hypothetical protein